MVSMPTISTSPDPVIDFGIARAISTLDVLPSRLDIPLVSDNAEDRRYLRAGVSEQYGRWRKDSVPHLIEIMDRLHPDDPCTHITVMKSVQSGVTTSVAENGIVLWVCYRLGSILYLTSGEKVGRIRSSSSIDTTIDDSGMADLVNPMSRRVVQKRADSALYKEFEGGIKLQIASYGSIQSIKSNTYQLIIADEWDEAPPEISDQGDIAGVIEGRTMAARLYKILEISTPTRMETSRIYKSYLAGDQRKYYVPCPICMAYQVLTLGDRTDVTGKKSGLIFALEKRDGGEVLDPKSVRYICQHCGGEIFEASKPQMLKQGEWRPTTGKPTDPRRHSYHSPGLISPFLSWERICQQFVHTKFGKEVLLFKDFTINSLGNPWAAVKSAASWEVLRDRAEDYVMGEVPEGALRLYGGVDVQADRLEMAVWGIGRGMEQWLIDYHIFTGDTSDLGTACWVSLEQAARRKYRILGAECEISIVAIDCGWDPKEGRSKDWGAKPHTVYQYIHAKEDIFCAIRGTSEIRTSFDVIKKTKIFSGITRRFDLNTGILKEMILDHIGDVAGPMALHMPKWRMQSDKKRYVGDELFRQMLSERYQEIAPGRFGWRKIYDRNEVWDTCIYAIGMAYAEGINHWDADAWAAYVQGLKEAAPH